VNYNKLATSISLAIIYLGQFSTAWADSSFEQQELITGLGGGSALAALIIFGAFYIKRKSKQQQLEAKAQLKTRDPNFDEQIFLDNVSTLFLEIKSAWTKRDMKPVRHLMTGDAYSRFTTQIEKHIRKGTFNRLDELSLNPPAITAIGSDYNNDLISVLITFTAKDYIVDDSGQKVSGSTNSKTKTEQWSFMRPLKATTKLKEEQGFANCPACGLPVQQSSATECESCHSKLNNWAFDWIISAISEPNNSSDYYYFDTNTYSQ